MWWKKIVRVSLSAECLWTVLRIPVSFGESQNNVIFRAQQFYSRDFRRFPSENSRMRFSLPVRFRCDWPFVTIPMSEGLTSFRFLTTRPRRRGFRTNHPRPILRDSLTFRAGRKHWNPWARAPIGPHRMTQRTPAERPLRTRGRREPLMPPAGDCARSSACLVGKRMSSASVVDRGKAGLDGNETSGRATATGPNGDWRMTARPSRGERRCLGRRLCRGGGTPIANDRALAPPPSRRRELGPRSAASRPRNTRQLTPPRYVYFSALLHLKVHCKEKSS